MQREEQKKGRNTSCGGETSSPPIAMELHQKRKLKNALWYGGAHSHPQRNSSYEDSRKLNEGSREGKNRTIGEMKGK